MADTPRMSMAEFARAIKARAPQLASFSDEDVVRGALERRPDLIRFLQTSEPRRELGTLNRAMTAAGNLEERIGKRMKGQFNIPAQIREAAPEISAGIRRTLHPSSPEARNYHGLQEIWKSLGQYKDPANVLGDIFSAYLMGTDTKVGETAGEIPKAVAKDAGTRFAIATQELMGAGKEPVFLERQKIRERNLGAQENTRLQNEAALDRARLAHNEEVRKWLESGGKDTSKVMEARRKLMETTQKAERDRLQQSGRPAEKRGAERRVSDYAEDFQQDAKRAKADVLAPLNKRWATFRELTRNVFVDKPDLFRIVERGQEMLKGAPPDLTEFKNFMKEIGMEYDDNGDLVMSDPEKSEHMPLDAIRAHSTAIGDKLARGGLPGGTFQALKFVKRALEDEIIQPQADSVGAGQFYRDLKRDWATYMTDFVDKDSPLANAIRAENTDAVRKIMLGDDRQNLSALAAKYQGRGKTAKGLGGLTPTTISAAGRLEQNVSDLTALRKVSGPRQGMVLESESPSLRTAREGKMPTASSTARPEFEPPVPKTAEMESLDPVKIRRDILTRTAGAPYRWWELAAVPAAFIPGLRYLSPAGAAYALEHFALKSPAFREWVARQSRRETPLPELLQQPTSAAADPLGVLK